ncbi:MAG TPA: RQC domain-containing protein, partial [Accumulibacter sp.]|nr:RQC domain-containing protein [Accumulibacter sp.]
LVDILRGKLTDKVQQFDHNRLPTFGVGTELDEMAWRSVFRQLLVRGVIEADATAYGALKLTDSARPILKGEIALELRRRLAPAKPRQKKTRTTSLAGQPAKSSPLLAGQADRTSPLATRLRQWRADCAREQGVPAYVILHDSTLYELAGRRPASLAELLDVPGIGQAKAQRYGDQLLALLAAESC